MPPIKVLRETFLGKKSIPFMSKRDKKRREVIDPEMIGLRTPQQDFDDLQSFKRVTSKKANLLGEEMDLYVIELLMEHMASYVCHSEYFWRQKEPKLDRSVDSEERSLLRRFLDFESLDREDHELTEVQKLAKMENQASDPLQLVWRQDYEDERSPAYKKLIKRVEEFLMSDKLQREELIDLLKHKLDKKTGLLNHILDFEACHTQQHRKLSQKCSKLSEKISDMTNLESVLDVEKSVQAQWMLALTSKNIEQCLDFISILVKFATVQINRQPVTTLSELDAALPSLQLTSLMTTFIMNGKLTGEVKLEITSKTFFDPISIKIELANDHITIPIAQGHKEAALNLESPTFILHKDGKYYLRSKQDQTVSFKHFQKYYKQKPVSDANEPDLSCLLKQIHTQICKDESPIFSRVSGLIYMPKHLVGKVCDDSKVYTLYFNGQNESNHPTLFLTITGDQSESSHQALLKIQAEANVQKFMEVVPGSFRVDKMRMLAFVTHRTVEFAVGNRLDSPYCISVFSLSHFELITTLEVPQSGGIKNGPPIHIANDEYINYTVDDNQIQLQRFSLVLPKKTHQESPSLISFGKFYSSENLKENAGVKLYLNAIQWLEILLHFTKLSIFGFEGNLSHLTNQIFVQHTLEYYKKITQLSFDLSALLEVLNGVALLESSKDQLQSVRQSSFSVLEFIKCHLTKLKETKDVSLEDICSKSQIESLFEGLFVLNSKLQDSKSHQLWKAEDFLGSGILKLSHQFLMKLITSYQLPLLHRAPYKVISLLVELTFCYLKQESTEKNISESEQDSSPLFSYQSEPLLGVESIDSFLTVAINKLLTEKYDDFPISPFVFHWIYYLSIKAQTDEGVFLQYIELVRKCLREAKDGTHGYNALQVLMNTVVLFDQQDPNFAKLLCVLVENASNNPQEQGINTLKHTAIVQMAGKLCAAIDSWSENDSNGDLIVQSSLLSGGIEEENLYMFSQDSLQKILALCQFSSDQSLTQAFSQAANRDKETSMFDFADETEGGLIKSIIHPQRNKASDLVISQLHTTLCKRRQFSFLTRMTQEGGNLVTRAAFAIMVKFTGLLFQFEQIQDQVQMELDLNTSEAELSSKVAEIFGEFQGIDQLMHLWEHANKMRTWFAEKKQILMERTEEKRMKQADSQQDQVNDEEVVTVKIAEIVKRIVEKTEFLVKLKTPEIFATQKNDLKRLPSLAKQPTYSASDSNATISDDWRDKVQNWRQEIEDRNMKITNKDTEDSKNVGIQQINALLQMSVTVDQIKTKVEVIVINACRRYAGLKLIDNVLSEDTLKGQQVKYMLSLFCTMQKDQRELSHYMDDIKGCGIAIEQKLRVVFFSIISKFLTKFRSDSNSTDALLQALSWNFLSRDFSQLHSIDLFKLFFRNFMPSDGEFTKMRLTFEELILSVLSRMTREDTEPDDDTSNTQLKRAKSHMDEDHSIQLLKSAFNEIFRLFDWFINTPKIGNKDTQSVGQPLKSEDPKEFENITIDSVDFALKQATSVESKILDNCIEPKTCEFRGTLEKQFIGQFLYLTNTLVNVAHKVPHALKMLHSVIANPFHLKTLMELMLCVSPIYQLKVIRIVQNLLRTKLPLVVFDEAINSSRLSLLTLIREEGSQLAFVKAFNQNKNDASLITFLYSYAFFLRNSKNAVKQTGNYDLSAFLIQTVIQVLDLVYPKDSPILALESVLMDISAADLLEQEFIFELIGAGMSIPTEGTRVRLIRPWQQSHFKFDQQYEVVYRAQKGKNAYARVTLYDAEREKFSIFSLADLQQIICSPLSARLTDDVFAHFETLVKQGCPFVTQCYILKLIAQNEGRIQDKPSFVKFLKAGMLEGTTDIADDLYRLGYVTYCFYQPLLFEGSIALEKKLATDFGEPVKSQKKRFIRASKITYKDGKPIDRTQDGPDSILKHTKTEEPVMQLKRSLIKNYYKVARQSKAADDKLLHKDCQDLWLFLSKVGFELFEKNQRFEKVNISVPVKVIYALLSFNGQEIHQDFSERTQFVEILKASFSGPTLTVNQKGYIMRYISFKLRKVLALQSGDEEVFQKVLSVDFQEIDSLLEGQLEQKSKRLKRLAKAFTQVQLNARSEYDYYSRNRKTFFNQVLKKLCSHSKGGDTYLLKFIRVMQLDMHQLVVRSLCSSLLYSLYSPIQDPEFDKTILAKLLMHYHNLKKNKHVNILEFQWLQTPRHFNSRRIHTIMQEAYDTKPELVTSMLIKQAALTRGYQFEAFISSDPTVQGQVFSHNLIAMLRLLASKVRLSNQLVDVYMRIALREIIILTFQANMALKDQDPDFANYSAILARKCFESVIALAQRVYQNAQEFAQSGQLSKIIDSQELAAICDQLQKKFGRFKDYKLANMNIFSFMVLELLTILRDAYNIAKSAGHELSLPTFFALLQPYDLIKRVLCDKKDSFAVINQLRQAQNKQPEWTSVDVVDGWTKLELQENSNFVELMLNDPEDEEAHQNLVNRTVAVSDNPQIDAFTKFYKFAKKKDSIQFKTKKRELYVKFLKDERFFAVLEEQNSKTLYHISTSEFKGAEPTQIFGVSKETYFVTAENGRRLFYVPFDENNSSVACYEVKLPGIGERVKMITPKHKNNVFKEWKAREQFDDRIKERNTISIYTVVMYSGLMFAMDPRIAEDDIDRRDKFKWEVYPSLPNGRLIDSVSIDDEKMFIVSNDNKLFGFSTYSSLSKADQQLYKKGLFMQKFLKPKKQRDGTEINQIQSAWIHKTKINNKLFRAQLIEAQTTNGKVICSSGERTMIGREFNEMESPANAFFILSYDHSLTNFTKVDVDHGLAMAIDQYGELWILCGKQSQKLNAGLPRAPGNAYLRRNIVFPIKTDILSRQNSKALDLKIGIDATYILAKDENGSQFVFFIGDKDVRNPMCEAIETVFKPGYEANYDMIDFNSITENEKTEKSRFAMILRNKCDPAKLSIRFRPASQGINLDPEYQPKQYSDKAKELIQELFAKVKVSVKEEAEGHSNSRIVEYFKKLKKLSAKDPLTQALVDEVVELRQNYFGMYNFLHEIMGLARVAAEDIYYLKPKQSYVMPSDVPIRDVTRQIVDLYQKALKEFNNKTLLSFLIEIKMGKFDDQTLQYDNYDNILLDRLAANTFKNEGRQERPNEFSSIFGQFFKRLKPDTLVKTTEYAFKISLMGEGAIDAGGPRRDMLSNLCSELISPLLSLLVPTGNNIANYGDHTQCYTLNPNACSLLELEKIQFFGQLLGWSINTRQGLGLDLAPHIWKRIIQGDDAPMTLEDLKNVDTQKFEQFVTMLKLQDTSDQEFEDCYPDTFMECVFGNGQVFELCSGGSQIKVTRDKIDQYVAGYVQKYFEQDRLQFAALLRGVESVCGKLMLCMLTEEVAETRGCSSKQVSWQSIVRQTTFDLDKPIKDSFVWCLKQMTNAERQAYLKFMSGASRLIPNRFYRIERHYNYGDEIKDKLLPIGHTCSFTIDIPEYSTKEIMLSQIRKAITLCGDIDQDNRHDYGDEEHNSQRSHQWEDQDHFGQPEDDYISDNGEDEGNEQDGEGNPEGHGEDGYGEEDGFEDEDGYDGEGEGESGCGSDSQSGSGDGSDSHASSHSGSNSARRNERMMHQAIMESIRDAAANGVIVGQILVQEDRNRLSDSWESVSERSVGSQEDDNQSEKSDALSEHSKKSQFEEEEKTGPVLDQEEKSDQKQEDAIALEGQKEGEQQQDLVNLLSLPRFKPTSIFKP